MNKEEFTAQSPTLCSDGKYRWAYHFDMLKNSTILFTIWKVICISAFIVWLFVIFLLVVENNKELKPYISLTELFVMLTMFFCVLGVVAYFMVAKQYGWKYMVIFEMDEEGIVHRQMSQQFDKAKTMGWFTAVVGAVSGNLSMTGPGISNAVRNSISTEFSKVKSVKISSTRNTIYLNAPLSHNQVYVATEYFDYVKEYILSRIPSSAKIK
ncbi:MAG: hypothetical protein IJS61_04455 [Firmicutes bacterium]|nr:hypothetical protein [Bacillota bacterium]